MAHIASRNQDEGNIHVKQLIYLDKERKHMVYSSTFYSEVVLRVQRLCSPALHCLFALTQFQKSSKMKTQRFGKSIHLTSSSSYFQETCLNLKLMRILLTVWIAVMMCWQYLSYSRNQDKFTVSLISWQKLIFLVFEEAVRIQSLCKFSWSFGLQSWFTGSILWWFSFFRKQSSLPSIKAGVRTCACAIALDRLDLKIVYVWLTYLVKIRMNLLSVLFWEGSLSSYFLRKLFKFGAYTNSLDHLDCSLAVIHNSLLQEGNFLLQ